MLLQTAGTEVFRDLVNILPKLDNTYSFLAFLFLIVTAALGFIDIDKRLRGILLAIMICSTTFFVYRYMESGLKLVRVTSLVHLVKKGEPVKVADNISIRLIDVESLEGKNKAQAGQAGGIKYNCTLPNDLIVKVFKLAKLDAMDSKKLCSKNQAEWEKYLQKLGHTGEVLKDIPFANLEIKQGSKALPQSSQWWTKDDIIEIGSASDIRFKLEQIYNPKESTTGEVESVDLKVLPQ